MTQVYDIVTHVLGIEGKQRGDEWNFCCFVHSDRHPSASVNLESGLWKCLACGSGGDLPALIAIAKGIPRREAQSLLRPRSPAALVAGLQRSAHGALVALQPGRRPPKLPQGYPPEPLDYLRARGFSDETLRSYGVGYVAEETFQRDRSTYSIRDYVALPIRDANDHLLAWCYRAAHETKLRYLYTPGVQLTAVWFGEQLHHAAESVVITEGALDSMWVAQCGLPALGLLGANMKHDTKLRALMGYKTVTLLLDRDAAGVRAAQVLGKALSLRVPVRIARYPRQSAAKDPAELSSSQVQRAVAKAIPYLVWSGAVRYT